MVTSVAVFPQIQSREKTPRALEISIDDANGNLPEMMLGALIAVFQGDQEKPSYYSLRTLRQYAQGTLNPGISLVAMAPDRFGNYSGRTFSAKYC